MPPGSMALQQQRMLQQQQQPTNTKAALQNMLTTRMGPGGQPLPPRYGSLIWQ